MFFQEQAQNKGVRFEVKERETQNSVKGDPDLMRQVFMNIFDNYVKYSSDSVVEIRHRIQKKTGNLIIEIEGESTPFYPEEDIFSLGVRGRNAEAVTSSGSGLGLHICKLIVERVFKGSISASFFQARSLAKFEIRIPDGFVTER